MGAALLRFALTGAGTEHLVVADDGTVRYQVLAAAHPAWADRAGTFGAVLDAPELTVARALAHDLVAAAPRPRERSGATVTAEVDGRRVTHPLDDPRGTAAELLSDLIDRARLDPLAVVALRAEPLDGGDVRIAFTSVGSGPVTFQVEPGSVRLRVQVDGTWGDGARGPARLSLVAPPEGFFPATTGPAELAAGGVARGLLPKVVPAGVEQVRVVVEGLVGLVGGDAVQDDTDDADDGLLGDLSGRPDDLDDLDDLDHPPAAPVLARFRLTTPVATV